MTGRRAFINYFGRTEVSSLITLYSSLSSEKRSFSIRRPHYAQQLVRLCFGQNRQYAQQCEFMTSNQLPKWILNKGHSLGNCSGKFSVIIAIFSLFQLKYLFIVTFRADLLWQSQRKCWIIIEQRANRRSFLFLGKLSEAIYNCHYLLVGFNNDSHHLFGDAVKASVYTDFSNINTQTCIEKKLRTNHIKWLCCVPSRRRKKISFLLSNSHVGKQKKRSENQRGS